MLAKFLTILLLIALVKFCTCNNGTSDCSASFKNHNRKTLGSITNTWFHGMTCQTGPVPDINIPNDYKYTPGIGAHKLHTKAIPWNKARKICNAEGGHLAIVNSESEANVLQQIFKKSKQVTGTRYGGVAFLGFHDLYTEDTKNRDWVTIFGEPLYDTGYSTWSNQWGGQPDNTGGVQHCGAFVMEGGLDDINCASPYGFFCEIPMNYIIP